MTAILLRGFNRFGLPGWEYRRKSGTSKKSSVCGSSFFGHRYRLIDCRLLREGFSAEVKVTHPGEDGIRLFALKNGMKFIAGNGKVQIEAHKDRINFTAKQAVRITSTEESIYITAPIKVVFNGGGSFTEWSSAGILHGTAGGWVEYAGSHVKRGPGKLGLTKPKFEACAQKVDTASASDAGSLNHN